jgi:hypothetical protein
MAPRGGCVELRSAGARARSPLVRSVVPRSSQTPAIPCSTTCAETANWQKAAETIASGAYSFAPSDPKRVALNTRGYAAIFFWLSHPGLGNPKMQPTCCAVFAACAVFARWAGIVAHMVGASQRLWCPVGERQMGPGVGVGRHTGQGRPMNLSTTQITADATGIRMRSPCRSACRGRLCVVMSLGRCRLSCRV